MTATTPEPDPKWLPQVREWWAAFWSSDQAARLQATARPALWRLFGWYHRREVMQKRADRKLMVKGSTGQPRVNPLIDQVVAIDRTIEALEKQIFGPLAAPGSEASDGADLLAAANARFAELVAQHDGDQPDPRLELLEGGAAEASA